MFGGELVEIPVPAWTDRRSCSCGLAGDACPFWKEVKARCTAVGAIGPGDPTRGPDVGWRGFPRALLGARLASADFNRQVRDAKALAVAIRETSGRPVVIDTSKGGARGLAYLQSLSDDFDVRFIHLIRDGRGVVNSRKSHHLRAAGNSERLRTAALRYSILWVFANVLFTMFFSLRQGRYLRVRYEDFIADPARTLERIGRFVDLDLSSVVGSVAAGAPFAAGHVVAGNRMRLAGGVQVQREPGSVPVELPPEDRRVFRWVAGWYAKLNGYG